MPPQQIKGMRNIKIGNFTDSFHACFNLYCFAGVFQEVEMVPTYKCIDIGLSCSYEASDKSETELMKKIADHTAKAHNMKTIPPDVMKKIKRAIKQ